MRKLADVLVWLVLAACCTFLSGALALPALAHQVTVDGETVNYSEWTNGLGKGCCNNQDCRPAKDAEVRYSPRVEVMVEGKWCEVKSHHYLKKGNAANANVAHKCVQVSYRGDDMGGPQPEDDPCDRLLCFQPKPLF
jgi:hypothetical protein